MTGVRHGDGPQGRPETTEEAHALLRSLLGAWALSACSAEETAAVEEHLTECAPCAEEALRLRDAVGLLHHERDLDLDPLLRSRVLDNCLGRRPARIPVPAWAGPYDAETARLDALLQDIGRAEWHAPVRLRWFADGRPASRSTDVSGVIGHLLAVDGLVAAAVGLDDPVVPYGEGRHAVGALARNPYGSGPYGAGPYARHPYGKDPGEDDPYGAEPYGSDPYGEGSPGPGPAERTEAFWRALEESGDERCLRDPWRHQAHTLVRTVSLAGRGVTELPVPYGTYTLPLRDALLERAFECWLHADDIASAVAYPYDPPAGPHLHEMIDLAVRLLPAALAERRRSGLAGPARTLVRAGAPGRSLRLEVEGAGGGHWYVALDSPAALAGPERQVALVALDGVEFCRLIAGHLTPEEAAAGQEGDREAIRDVLHTAASLSHL
ncbi:zf-HC2 domain-containing protein [Streptomyces fradiae]|uniref:zf-HC2 domain-containing protein n=1 Tax=Streptomyces fradiae TaxID=1906 RepID=UPI00382E74DF